MKHGYSTVDRQIAAPRKTVWICGVLHLGCSFLQYTIYKQLTSVSEKREH